MSAASPDHASEARRWLGEARNELLVAVVLVEDERVPPRAACFHAHLAAEKAMKALIIFREIVLAKSHDLARLIQLLPRDDRVLFDVDDLEELNPWTIEGRYPADLSDPSTTAVVDLVACARRVVDAVDGALRAATAE